MKFIRTFFAMAAITGAFFVGLLSISAGAAHADSVNWDAIAECESGGNWATNTGNGFYGGLQFTPATWSSHGGVGNPASAPREEQIRVAEKVFTTQGLGAWPTCGSTGGSAGTFSAGSVPAVWKPGAYLRASLKEIMSLVPGLGR